PLTSPAGATRQPKSSSEVSPVIVTSGGGTETAHAGKAREISRAGTSSKWVRIGTLLVGNGAVSYGDATSLASQPGSESVPTSKGCRGFLSRGLGRDLGEHRGARVGIRQGRRAEARARAALLREQVEHPALLG